MNVTRRKFLRAGSVCALFAGLGLSPSELVLGQSKRKNPRFEVPYESKTNPVFYFNRETFAPHVGTDFRFYQKGARKGYGLRLEEVFDRQAQLKARRLRAHDGECFSLYFRGPASKDLPQGSYRMQHGALGVFTLFLVPGRPDSEGVVYEAVINHLA
jgi:hypothetical protein